MIDVISQGRLDVGLVRGVPMEISAGNSNPVGMKERFWEAADLITTAWSSRDGAFNWEGDYFHHRQVNVWPPTYQSPHPNIWVPTQSSGTVVEVAERGYTVATILRSSPTSVWSSSARPTKRATRVLASCSGTSRTTRSPSSS